MYKRHWHNRTASLLPKANGPDNDSLANNNCSKGHAQAVSMLAFNSNNPSSNPTVFFNFYSVNGLLRAKKIKKDSGFCKLFKKKERFAIFKT